MNHDSSLPEAIRALPAISDDLHTTRRLSAPGCEMLFVTARAGYEHSMHAHDTDDVNWVVSGGLTLSTEDGDRHVGPTEWYELRPGQPHGVRFDADSMVIELRFAAPLA
ncbi:cupin domain-containing protein [Kribbella shirazensis]|uniref:Quercetin dioxygenase-like cupin family protein n=1 Tax=Kribbella shirazensis TaxID=1105143 RepID=A0A7X5VHZ3_9ACTN|nr:hypothetical protein [Kribbella shirazensis]NIK61409.1 quercetin dioxygenase-like cupin family protein [Kribbella shirazensis]